MPPLSACGPFLPAPLPRQLLTVTPIDAFLPLYAWMASPGAAGHDINAGTFCTPCDCVRAGFRGPWLPLSGPGAFCTVSVRHTRPVSERVFLAEYSKQFCHKTKSYELTRITMFSETGEMRPGMTLVLHFSHFFSFFRGAVPGRRPKFTFFRPVSGVPTPGSGQAVFACF